MGRISRQKLIIELIAQTVVATQEDLVNQLRANGIDVTQATISRDIKELGLIKEPDNNKIVRYTYVLVNKLNINTKFHNLFRESVISIDFANNILVIKTIVGSANSAAAMIDSFEMKELNILGSVAGDDAIIIVLKTEEDARKLNDILKEFR